MMNSAALYKAAEYENKICVAEALIRSSQFFIYGTIFFLMNYLVFTHGFKFNNLFTSFLAILYALNGIIVTFNNTADLNTAQRSVQNVFKILDENNQDDLST